MWLNLNNAFLSIVEPHRAARGNSPTLLVRARRPGDIERVFPNAKVEVIDRRDYMFRAVIDRKLVAEALAAQVMGINYGNFKNSVADHDLHDAYARTWHTMAALQPQRPYSTYSDRPAPKRPTTVRRPKQAAMFANGAE